VNNALFFSCRFDPRSEVTCCLFLSHSDRGACYYYLNKSKYCLDYGAIVSCSLRRKKPVVFIYEEVRLSRLRKKEVKPPVNLTVVSVAKHEGLWHDNAPTVLTKLCIQFWNLSPQHDLLKHALRMIPRRNLPQKANIVLSITLERILRLDQRSSSTANRYCSLASPKLSSEAEKAVNFSA
jgi:hypothetical protein